MWHLGTCFVGEQGGAGLMVGLLWVFLNLNDCMIIYMYVFIYFSIYLFIYLY